MNKLKVDYSGFKKLKSRLNHIQNKEVQVGFFDKIYPGAPTDAFPDGYNVGVQVAQVAYWNNVPTEESPARPFMEETLESSETIKNVKAAVNDMLEGKPSATVLNALGEKERELMKKIIETYDMKDNNSDDWIEMKGFDDVLQYTNFMLDSVEFRVE
jgi:hypothetical protein